ncbi:MAG: glycoside hydrolase family 25 protein [Actinomycetota bacterium]|nr:glycoside hydrolase family 25 protein [Actinomycetota bacterium]
MAWSCGSSSNIKGVDVSADQGSQIGTESYWSSLKQDGYRFGFIKATEGTSYKDPYLAGAWSGCNAVNGLDLTYLYHFLDWDTSGETQANHFWSVISGLRDPTFDSYKTVLAVDVEENLSTGTPSMTIVNDFINRLLALGANSANFVIYTNYDTWVNYLKNPKTWDYLAVWLAAFNGIAWCPDYTFGGWPNWSYMQYGKETLLGAVTDVDEMNA